MLPSILLSSLLVATAQASPAGPPSPLNQGQSIEIVRHRHPRSPENLGHWAKSHRDGLIEKYGGGGASGKKTKRNSGTNLLTNQGADSSFYGSIAVGTPPVAFYAILDTGSADLWVADQKCTSGCRGVPTFDATASSSYQNLSTPFQITYGSGAARGNLGHDVIQMAGFAIENQTFATTDEVTEGVLSDPVSGIVGLGWQGISAARIMPFWQVLAEEGLLSEPLMSFQLTRFNNDSQVQQLEPGGTFTLGATNTSLYTGDIEYQNLVGNGNTYWLLEITTLTVQSSSIPLGSGTASQAAIDTGTTLVGGPPDAIAAIFDQVPGSQPASGQYDGYYTYPCDTQVNVEMSFGGRTWTVSPADFRLAAIDDESCLGGFFVLDIGGSAPAWIVGDTFLKNVYSVFRFDPPSVGFATLSSEALAMNGANVEPPTATIGTVATATGRGNAASSLRSSWSISQIGAMAVGMAGVLLGGVLVL